MIGFQLWSYSKKMTYGVYLLMIYVDHHCDAYRLMTLIWTDFDCLIGMAYESF